MNIKKIFGDVLKKMPKHIKTDVEKEGAIELNYPFFLQELSLAKAFLQNTTMSTTLVEKTWGREVWLVNNKKYCSKIITCISEKWSSGGNFHYHKKKDEIFFITYGTLLLDVKDEMSIITRYHLITGNSFRIKPNTLHRFASHSSVCEFVEVSTQHLEEDSYRVKA